jgi:CHAT domain-containing protein
VGDSITANADEHQYLASFIELTRKRAWSAKKASLFSSEINFLEIFRPLVEWLEGVLELGDHLVFAADSELYNIPIHLIPFCGEPLGDFITVSRIQGMQSLAVLLSKAPTRPSRAMSFVVPSLEDIKEKGMQSKQKLDALYASVSMLSQNLSEVKCYTGREADLEKFYSSDFNNVIAHFSTHGRPPRFAYTDNNSDQYNSPLDTAGLLLAAEGRLPCEEDFKDTNYKGRLSPRKILNEKKSYEGSHVSLMACVSGLVKEGVGGDALGLEWAFLQFGASSILSSYWNVGAESSARFFNKFYGYWLGGDTRAVACQKSIVENKLNSKDVGAFLISGDWR